MNPGEHQIMARVEDHHWWYQGLRDAIGRCLDQPDLRLPRNPRVLDAGCGTGATLRFLGDLLNPSYLGGFDSSEEAIDLAAAKVPRADLYRGDIRSPEVHANGLDLVVCLDVVSQAGLDASLGGLARLVSALDPGGVFLLHLPAYNWLYSEHDVAVQTRERFTARQVDALYRRLSLPVVRSSYRLFALLPALAVARLPSMIRARRPRRHVGSDLHRVRATSANGALFAMLQAENRLIAHGVSLPWGSSVFAIGRKP
jgi:SAM-dependent methyltransferase